MDKREDILTAAEASFETRGFHAIPIDEVITSAGVSPRTLYRYFPGKTELAVAVLERRHVRFLESMQTDGDTLDSLFNALRNWLETTPANGCLFLRALGEYGDESVAPRVKKHKTAFRRYLGRVAEAEAQSADYADALFLLVEGATALAPQLGARRAVDSARKTANRLLR